MKNTSEIFEFYGESHTMQLVDMSVDEKAFANQLVVNNRQAEIQPQCKRAYHEKYKRPI